MTNVIRGVIFDLGGTLVDFHSGAADWRSMEARGTAALFRFLVERGHEPPEAAFHQTMWNAVSHGWEEAMAGRANARLLDIIASTAARFGVALDDEARMQATQVYTAGVGDEAVPLEGAHEMLRELKGRGLRRGLLSNTTWPGQLHRKAMQDVGLLELLDETVFSSDVGLWKPNAPAFHCVVERLGVSPSEAVFVGDLPEIDVVGAQRAGLRAVWIATDGIELGNVRPDAIVHHLAELPAALDGLEKKPHADR
jgi:putative hydrolase of the HAD superfamily